MTSECGCVCSGCILQFLTHNCRLFSFFFTKTHTRIQLNTDRALKPVQGYLRRLKDTSMTATMLLQDSMLKPSVFRSPSERQKQSLQVMKEGYKRLGVLRQSEAGAAPGSNTSVDYFLCRWLLFGHFRRLHLIAAPLQVHRRGSVTWACVCVCVCGSGMLNLFCCCKTTRRINCCE